MATLTITREAVLAGGGERKDYWGKVKDFFSAMASVAELTAKEKAAMDGDLMGITSQCISIQTLMQSDLTESR